jgi:hypothetical protein
MAPGGSGTRGTLSRVGLAVSDRRRAPYAFKVSLAIHQVIERPLFSLKARLVLTADPPPYRARLRSVGTD